MPQEIFLVSGLISAYGESSSGEAAIVRHFSPKIFKEDKLLQRIRRLLHFNDLSCVLGRIDSKEPEAMLGKEELAAIYERQAETIYMVARGYGL